ncbi:PfaD family polyunsaturated fatty acid/polyketide biosynthesis protein [Glycomyces xiaoerkulensis]|uniref:PfaD family polyunsaturated fatty acid/polyketide biosynthesis protein n=1 Tax=Glycomyces xiaoerkulensis TaxID=2038139 RepID=UPI000C258AF7|nr:PfaD family polyunsaturated fatty acid/polyketide biosynthesis protein [Glycomyces xiaoerkulensis]
MNTDRTTTRPDAVRTADRGAPAAGPATVHTDPGGIHQALARLDRPCYIVDTGQGVGIANSRPEAAGRVVAATGPLTPDALGSSAFRARHGVRYAYMGGAMAGGIASEELVIALARSGALASFGAAGLLPERIETALTRFAAEIPGLPYAVNLIHSPSEDALERDCVELLLKHGVRCVEASAFMDLTPHVVRYRAAGLRRGADGRIRTDNRLIAKVSRAEVAERFMRPAPDSLLDDLASRGLITAEQAELARHVPMADDITAEADSGGHTDRRPLTALFPTLLRLREAIGRELRYERPIGVGAAGGIGTPRAAAAAFAMGADYIVVGSVHQACLESGTSDAARSLLAGASSADCEMAPAADMFELGVELQVLKKGTFFPMRAKKLYELYQAYDGIEALPAAELRNLEQQIFRRSVDEVWAEVERYFTRRDPEQLRRAASAPRRRMALLFRWYLGMASRWAVTGDADRRADYQLWCGPAMGAFNEWVGGTYLAAPENRRAADVAHHLMRGAAFTSRVHQFALGGVRLPAAATEYTPAPLAAPEAAR